MAQYFRYADISGLLVVLGSGCTIDDFGSTRLAGLVVMGKTRLRSKSETSSRQLRITEYKTLSPNRK